MLGLRILKHALSVRGRLRNKLNVKGWGNSGFLSRLALKVNISFLSASLFVYMHEPNATGSDIFLIFFQMNLLKSLTATGMEQGIDVLFRFMFANISIFLQALVFLLLPWPFLLSGISEFCYLCFFNFIYQVRKGDTIGEFLRAVQQQLAPEYREVRTASVVNLLYVKEDLIIPHVWSQILYYFYS